jgi:hypothetical protein
LLPVDTGWLWSMPVNVGWCLLTFFFINYYQLGKLFMMNMNPLP